MHLQFKPGIITGHYYVKKLKSELFLPILPIFVRYGAPLHTIRTTRSNGSRASSPGCREFPVPVSPEGEGPATVVKEWPCEILGRRCVESGLRMRHFRRGPFAPVGKGFFSTRSTSKGISDAARMLSDKVSRPDENESLGG